MQAVYILAGALIVTALMSLFPFVREWWLSFLSDKRQALLLSMVMLAMFLGVSSNFDPTTLADELAGSRRLIRALIFSGLFLISTINILHEPKHIRFAGSPLKVMLIYAFIAISSASYSIGPVISLWKGFEVLTLVLIIISLSGKITSPNNLKQLLDSLNLISLFLVLTVLIGLLLYPQEALHSAESSGQHVSYLGVRGLVPVINPATQGALAAILLISALSYLLTREKETRKNVFGLWLIMIISITLIILAHSRTQIFACSFAALLLLYFTRRYLLAIFVFTLGGIALLGTSNTLMSYIYRGQTEQQFLTMTGRTQHWEAVLSATSDSYLFGQGFYAAQRIMFGSGSVDNTYLESFVGLGIVGVIALVIPILIASLLLFKTRPRSKRFTQLDTLWIVFAGIFTILLARSFTSPTFASMHPMMLYYLITLLASASLRKFQLSTNGEKSYDQLSLEGHVDNVDKITGNKSSIIPKRQYRDTLCKLDIEKH